MKNSFPTFLTFCLFFLLTGIGVSAQTTEDFESETGQTFSQGGVNFTATSNLNTASCGACGYTSDGYLESNVGGTVGEIQITTPNRVFRILDVRVYLSSNGGTSTTTGDITFNGTVNGGGAVTHTFTGVTHPGAAQYTDPLSFAGTPFENVDLTSVEIVLGAGLNYLAMDDFRFLDFGSTGTNVCETFEGDGPGGATTFSDSGVSFSMTNQMVVGNFAGGGSNSLGSTSDFYIESDFNNAPHSAGSVGEVQITTANKVFQLLQLDLWVDTDGNTGTSEIGTINIIGEKTDGSTVTASITSTMSGTSWSPGISFAGTPLNGVDLVSFDVVLTGSASYVAIDNLCFSVFDNTAVLVSINDVSMTEGDAGTQNYDFTITRSDNSTAFDVTAQTADISATAGVDYTAVGPSTVSFAAGGSLTQTFTVSVAGDLDPEPNETFSVNLSGATNGASISDGTGVGTIVDNDVTCEDFEGDGGSGSTTFSHGGINFSVDNELRIDGSAGGGGGATGSDFYLESNIGNVPHVAGSIGKIQITSAGQAFEIVQLDLWTSNDGNATDSEAGDVTFVGTLVGGGTVSATVTSTGVGSDWTESVSFAGTPLENAQLTELDVQIVSPVNYVAIDNFCFATYALGPELDVRNAADNADITNGSTLRTLPLGTEYGSVCVDGGMVTNTFRAENNGGSTLTFGADALALSNTTDFSIITDLPNNGTLVAGGVATFSIQFNPATIGTRTCTVTIRSDDADEDPYTFLIGGFGQATPTFTAPADLCLNAGVQTGLGSGSPTGGFYSGPGVTNDGNGLTYTFDPAAAGVGVHTITYTVSGCPATDDVEVFALPSVTMAIPANQDEYCVNDGIQLILLSGSPTGGVYSGTGVTDSGDGISFTFNPAVAGAGTHTVTYTFTDGNGCSGSASDNIDVNALDDASFSYSAASYCMVGPDPTPTVTGLAGGTFSSTPPGLSINTSTGTIDLSASTPNTYSVTYTTAGTCPNSSSQSVTIAGSDVTVSVSPASVLEDGAANLVYTFTRACTADTLSVFFDVDGTLNSFNDYTQSGATSYSFAGGRVFFADGVATAQVTIDPTMDNTPELDETLILTVLPGSRYTVGTPSSATGTVEDDDSATISISDVTMNEGDAGSVSFCFTISPSFLPEEEVTLTAMTANGTATSGAGAIGQDDYIPKTDIVSINSDFPNPQFCVTVKSDNVVELNEIFYVNLSALNANGQNVTFADTQGEGTITNDDQCVISFINQPYQKIEGNSGTGTYQFEYNSSNPIDVLARIAITHSDGTATLADNDYAGSFFTTGLPQAGGNAIAGVPVIIGDTKVEPDETFQVVLSQNNFFGRNIVFAGGGPTISAPVTILNDDMATVTLSGGTSQTEGDAGTVAYTFTATLEQEVVGGFTIPYSTNDGTATTADNDYQDNDGMLTFTGTAGEMKTITVLANGDLKVEADETFTVALGAPSNANVSASGSPQTATIRNDDVAEVTLSGGTAKAEGNSGTIAYTFTATLSQAVDGGFTLPYSTNDGTATVADNDYQDNDGILTFTGTVGEMQTITVLVNGDNKVELNETFTVSLGMPSNINVGTNGSPQTGTITNDDQCVLSFILLPFGNTEGNSGITTYRFIYSKSNPVDVGFSYRLTHTDGSATSADNDYQTDYYVNTSGNAGGFQLFVSSIVGDTKVEPDEFFNLRFSENDFKGRNIVFAGGASFLETTVTITNDDIDWGDAPDSYGTLAASNGPSHGGSNLKLGATNDGEADGLPSANADGDAAEDDGVTFTSTLIAGNSATVDVTASSAALLNAWVDFDQSGTFNSPTEQVFTDVAVVAGVNNLNFAIPASAADGNTFARFRLNSTGGLAPTGAASDGEVEDYQVGIIATMFSIDDPMVNEGDAGTTNLSFTVSRSTNAANCSVNYAITGGTATSGDDYQPLAAGTVNFAAGGALTQMVNVVVNGDMIVELDETVEMTLSNPVSGIIADGDGTGTIKNDDSAIVTMSNPFITEGGDAGSLILTFNVNVDKLVDVPVNFSFATSDGTATLADNDYVANSGSSGISSGTTVAYLQVFENGDCQIEANEFFNMTLSNLMAMGRDVTFAGGGATLGSTGTINNDDALPEIYIPATFTQSTDPNQCSATVTVPKASTASICGTGMLEFRHRPVDASNNPTGPWSAWIPEANNTQVFAVGKHEVEWRITDDSGSNMGNFYFTIFDGQGPMVNCMPFTAQLDADGNASITPTDVYAGGNDNCSPVTPVSVSPNTFDCSNLGDVTVTLNAVDGVGNPGSCMTTVTVADGIAPMAVCKNISINLDANGMASIVPADVDGGTTDNCGFTLSLDDMDFDCGDIPSTMVTLTATDASGNGHSCMATVTVNDVTPPTVLCMNATVQLDATGNVSITPATVFAGSSDNCGFIGITGFGPTEFDCDDIGENTVTLNVTDGNGNDNFCTATVTVEDNIPAVVACNSVSLSLNSMGQASITPADLFDAANSTDNCGTFNLTGLSQSDFTCVDEGVNTITLYVEDAGGNVSTCTGTVTIEGFLEIVSVTHTDESCPQSGDGTISIVASAPAGQLLYSVDGGATWQATGEFEFLSPGTYNIVVQVYGVPSLCVKTTTETVGTQSGGGMTWYADHDNDGYSSGITLVQCQQPTGFKLAADLIATSGDCNDYDPNQFPGQTWMKDSDGDGYSDGTTVVSCSQPAGYGLNLPTGDCDDDDAAVNPGAVEVCNGIDDNCDGEIDEGVLGGLTWVGNVNLTSQAQVDAFSQCYSIIDGNLTIQNTNVVDLSNLILLTEVTGDVFIKSTGLTSMAGLDNLTTIGGYLKIQYNNSLTTLDGLDAVVSVGDYLRVYRNNILTDCCAIHALLDNGGVGGSVYISRNDTGCDSVSEIEMACAGSSPLIAPPTSDILSSTDAEEFFMNVFPNPNSGIFQVKITGALEGANLRMLDATGQVKWMKEVTEGDGNYPIKMGRLVTGIYFLQYTDGENSWTEKVIIR